MRVIVENDATSAAIYEARRRLREGPNQEWEDFALVRVGAGAGERRAQATLERVGEYLGIGISNVVTGLGVGRVVVGERLTAAWQIVRGPLNEAVARSMAGRVAGVSVEPSARVMAALRRSCGERSPRRE